MSAADASRYRNEGQFQGWNSEHERVLKEWAEIASIYSWMHSKAHTEFRKNNLRIQLPVIILSTLTGMANFAQSSMPPSWGVWAPMVIGFINIISGVLTTIAQFLRLSELSEGHRVAVVSYGKLSRMVRTQLALQRQDRSVGGGELIVKAQEELNRLFEQGPEIPADIRIRFAKRALRHPSLAHPEILQIKPVTVWTKNMPRKDPNDPIKCDNPYIDGSSLGSDTDVRSDSARASVMVVPQQDKYADCALPDFAMHVTPVHEIGQAKESIHAAAIMPLSVLHSIEKSKRLGVARLSTVADTDEEAAEDGSEFGD